MLRRALASGARARTLGSVVDELLRRDCKSAAQLVDALLPGSKRYLVLVRGPDGSPVPQLPHLDAWVFTWHVTRTFSNLTMRLGTGEIP